MEQWTYYVSVLPYFWVLATPVVGAVFGLYLYVALNVFECHYNEAFSALRISSYKNFVRLHITPTGDLEVFAFGIDKMPRKWCRCARYLLACVVLFACVQAQLVHTTHGFAAGLQCVETQTGAAAHT